jgi:hypothetical protein
MFSKGIFLRSLRMSPSAFLRGFTVLAMLAGAGECAATRVGELLVREGKGGAPCFTISEAEEARGGTPDFQAIAVGEVGSKALLWQMAMPPGRTFPVTVRMCIPYAGRLSVLPQTAAAALAPGILYEVAIKTRPGRDYKARFCLMQADGVLRVRNIGLSVRRPACEQGINP